MGIDSILDYGAGKQTLAKSLSTLPVTSYDPAIEKISEKPEGKFDLVVCTDVMEHIEPDYLDAVLDDLRRYTGKMVFLNVATRPAVKSLPDGRNAHLIVEDYRWWWPKLVERFECVQFSRMGESEFNFIGEPRRLD